MPSASAADRLRAFRAMQKRATTAEQTVERLTAELAALKASSERQITNLRAEVERLRGAPPEVTGTITILPDPPHVADAIRQLRRGY